MNCFLYKEIVKPRNSLYKKVLDSTETRDAHGGPTAPKTGGDAFALTDNGTKILYITEVQYGTTQDSKIAYTTSQGEA